MPCSKGMVKCRRDCLHRAMVRDYRAAREAAELRREAATAGYATETRQFGPILDFRAWLVWLAGERTAAA